MCRERRCLFVYLPGCLGGGTARRTLLIHVERGIVERRRRSIEHRHSALHFDKALLIALDAQESR